jgi:GWxTD domain-containing protein
VTMRIRVALVLCLLAATAVSGQVSDKYKEWREGPVQWIMTGDEQRAWKNLKSDAEASAFVDLFWARRDPTTGTFENEFRAEHEGRVLIADRDFSEKDSRGQVTRGSMTDRGRVYIVLGSPSRMAKTASQANGSQADSSTLGGTGRIMSGREEWVYLRDLTKKWGVPEATVAFIQHPQTGHVTRNVQRTDFITASSGAIKSYIVNRDLTAVPEWAAQGGLTPVTFRLVPATPVAASGQPVPRPLPVESESGAPVSGGPADPIINAPLSITYEPQGVSRLTLSRDVFEIDAETKTDPFLTLQSVEAFHASEELGWASQICTASNEEPAVKYQVRLTGTAAGEVIDRAGEPDELVPDRIRALNGCYMMRGGIPLEGMSPGNYELEVSVYDPSKRSDTVLKKAFRIE